jgi:hypothetical protein
MAKYVVRGGEKMAESLKTLNNWINRGTATKATVGEFQRTKKKGAK